MSSAAATGDETGSCVSNLVEGFATHLPYTFNDQVQAAYAVLSQGAGKFDLSAVAVLQAYD